MNFTKLAVALSACGMVAMASAQAAPLKIALVETLSGAQASTGLMYRSAANYGLQQLNEAGGWNGEAIQIAEYDNKSGPAGASDKVKAAIADGARIIIQEIGRESGRERVCPCVLNSVVAI